MSRLTCFKYELGTGVMCANTVNGTAFNSSIPMYGNDASSRLSSVPCGSVGARRVSSATARSSISLYASPRFTPSALSNPSTGSVSASSNAPCLRTRSIAAATSSARLNVAAM